MQHLDVNMEPVITIEPNTETGLMKRILLPAGASLRWVIRNSDGLFELGKPRIYTWETRECGSISAATLTLRAPTWETREWGSIDDERLCQYESHDGAQWHCDSGMEVLCLVTI